jgi:hypothetical protein
VRDPERRRLGASSTSFLFGEREGLRVYLVPLGKEANEIVMMHHST